MSVNAGITTSDKPKSKASKRMKGSQALVECLAAMSREPRVQRLMLAGLGVVGLVARRRKRA